MLWQKDKAYRASGRWVCAEKRRAYNQRRSAQRIAWVADKEARDPITRINHRLYSRRYKALLSMAARHRPAEEGS